MVMQHDLQVADALLGIIDDDTLLAFDAEQASDLEFRALETSFLGIRIRGPERLNLRDQQDLPLLLLSKTTGRRDWQVIPRRNAVLVGVDRGTGTVRAAWAFPTHKRINSERMPRSLDEGEEPGPEDADSVVATVQLLTGRQSLDLPWTEGEHSLTLIRYDWVSNTVKVRLESEHAESIAPYPVEDARKLLLGSEEQLARFQRDEDTPELGGPGATLAAPMSARADAGGFMVRGALQVPVPAGCIVARDGTADPQLPTVVLRAALLLIKRDELSPVRAELEIPVFTSGKVLPGDEVEGCFALDLYALGLRQQLLESDTLLYLVVGDHVAGPYPVEARP